MLAYMLSPTDFICLGDGGTDGGSDGKSSLDLLRDKDGNSDESSGYQVDDGAALHRFIDALKRRAFWSLNEDILKITILKTNTPYPSRKIRRIRACTHQRPQRNKDQYAVSKGLNTPYSRYGINIIFWKISSVVPTLRNPQYAVSNSWIRRDLDNSTSNILIPLDSWTSGLLVYKLPLSVKYGVSNSIRYGVSSFLSNTTYSSQQINTTYPLPLDAAYRSSDKILFRSRT
ncbi:hypothetical protein Tco_0743427 [Tanacetum coccineum]